MAKKRYSGLKRGVLTKSEKVYDANILKIDRLMGDEEVRREKGFLRAKKQQKKITWVRLKL